MPGTIDKVIVTNLGVLKAKYGSKYGLITKALDGLNAAYKARGLTSLVVGLGDAKAMKSLKAPLVTDPNSPKQNKNAIDGVYRALTPSYVVILGAIDVVPHQPLKDPVHGDG